MLQPLADLINLLDLEPIEQDIFRGTSADIGGRSVFGGQVLSQALKAAAGTVEGRTPHSLHAYFLRPGDVLRPIVYAVERIRDGRSFTTRRVTAIQHGRPIFYTIVSFQVDEEGFEHQIEMPEVTGPEDLPSLLEIRAAMQAKDPDRFRNRPVRDLPVEFRPIQPANPYELEESPPVQNLWFRAVDKLPDDPVLHRCVLAYASDYGLLRTVTLPHRISFRQGNSCLASLDHAMWFLRDVRADEWLLFAMDSPSSGNARGLARGNIFSRDGRLVASVAQEGLMRVSKEST